MTDDELFGPGWLSDHLTNLTEEMANKPRILWPRYADMQVRRPGEQRWTTVNPTAEVHRMLENLRTVE